ncbi:MAG: leucyl aminopeptidase family protein [Rhodospirillales bacterium]|jgi:leucyl aminopeptidase|nr:leucyl aminopeptidase family protein [Rhodospirillales bacterium]
MSTRHGLVEAAPGEPAVAIAAVEAHAFPAWRERQSESRRRWLDACGFRGERGSFCVLPGQDGALQGVVLVVGAAEEAGLEMWDWAAVPPALPPGAYGIASPISPERAAAAATGWALACYRFDRYRKPQREPARLVWPEACGRAEVLRTADAVAMARDLINTPANDMGPEDLAAAAAGLADRYDARVTTIVGDELLAQGYPAIHAVGRASARAPRLIDLRWGDPFARKLTLVGKGVCFDTGGLDIKTSAGMKLMKKDMGGAAIVLGLARMIMDAELPVRLRVLVPAVENSISGNAIRPLDVVPTRKGISVEIGNTDAEGRVILADALHEAAREGPDLLVDCATLTGAARVALGPELPALFCNDDALAESLLAHGEAVDDPLWRLPLWPGYRRLLDGKTAELTNAPDSPFAGAILAALFMAEFVGPATSWIHIDAMAWNVSARPGRPEGGEASALRALYALIAARFGAQ